MHITKEEYGQILLLKLTSVNSHRFCVYIQVKQIRLELMLLIYQADRVDILYFICESVSVEKV